MPYIVLKWHPTLGLIAFGPFPHATTAEAYDVPNDKLVVRLYHPDDNVKANGDIQFVIGMIGELAAAMKSR